MLLSSRSLQHSVRSVRLANPGDRLPILRNLPLTQFLLFYRFLDLGFFRFKLGPDIGNPGFHGLPRSAQVKLFDLRILLTDQIFRLFLSFPGKPRGAGKNADGPT